MQCGDGLQMLSRAKTGYLGGLFPESRENGLEEGARGEVEVGTGCGGCPQVPSPLSFPI